MWNNKLFELKEIKKIYKEKVALYIDKLDIPKKNTAILGKSGAGKSTLLFLLSLLSDFDKKDKESDIILYIEEEEEKSSKKLKEISFKKLKEREKIKYRRKYFGFIFQESYLIPHLSVLDNCMMVLNLNKEYKNKTYKEREERIKDFLKKVNIENIEEVLKKKPRELSVGQKQRIAIVRALIHSPKIIFGDEITGSLDPINSKIVLDLVNEQNKENNSILILVTHDMMISLEYCEYFIFLEEGKIKEKIDKEEKGKDYIEKYIKENYY